MLGAYLSMRIIIIIYIYILYIYIYIYICRNLHANLNGKTRNVGFSFFLSSLNRHKALLKISIVFASHSYFLFSDESSSNIIIYIIYIYIYTCVYVYVCVCVGGWVCVWCKSVWKKFFNSLFTSKCNSDQWIVILSRL